MLLTNPYKVKFENETDVVDYVTRGLPPTSKNYTAVMNAVRKVRRGITDEDDEQPHVFINPDMTINCDDETFEKIMDRIYENRIRNRNIGIGVSGAVILGVLVGLAKHRSSSKDDDEE